MVMAENSEISWTDASWNPATGCDKISPGCKGCYAIRDAHRMAHNPNPKIANAFAGLTQIQGGKPNWTGKVNLLEDRLEKPLQWRKPKRIFVNSESDLFHDAIPFEFIDRVFAVMALAQQHVFQVLTKRPERMLEYLTQKLPYNLPSPCPSHYNRARAVVANRAREMQSGKYDGSWPLPNVWLGVSAENQEWADKRIPLLLQCPAAVRWVSAEPLLGPLDLTKIDLRKVGEDREKWTDALAGADFVCDSHAEADVETNRLDWVVAGGESGPGARPMHPDWPRSLRDQCAAAGVAYHFKQWGEHGPVFEPPYPTLEIAGDTLIGMGRLGKKAAGRVLDGVTHDAFPVVA